MQPEKQASSPEADFKTYGKEITSPVMQQGEQFQKKLGAILDGEDREKLETRNKRTQELLQLIQQEVDKRRTEIMYDYEENDYIKRLCMSDEEFEEILRKKVLIGGLGEYYTELTSLYGDNPVILKKLLKEYCIEDLVYEGVEKYEQKEYKEKEYIISREELKKRLKNNRWDDLKGVKTINLEGVWLSVFDTASLEKIFSNLKGVKTINLVGALLSVFDTASLEKIFSHLKGVKHIDLSSNELGNLDTASLEKIFSNLKGVKTINLDFSKLGALNKESLRKVFSHLTGVKNIVLSGNNLSSLNREGLKEIFSHLKGLKSINLSSNNLGYLDTESLKEIFSNLRGVKRMDLSDNDLTDEQKDLITQLLPDAQIKF